MVGQCRPSASGDLDGSLDESDPLQAGELVKKATRLSRFNGEPSDTLRNLSLEIMPNLYYQNNLFSICKTEHGTLIGQFLQAVQAMRKEDLRRRNHAAEVGHVPVQAPGLLCIEIDGLGLQRNAGNRCSQIAVHVFVKTCLLNVGSWSSNMGVEQKNGWGLFEMGMTYKANKMHARRANHQKCKVDLVNMLVGG